MTEEKGKKKPNALIALRAVWIMTVLVLLTFAGMFFGVFLWVGRMLGVD